MIYLGESEAYLPKEKRDSGPWWLSDKESTCNAGDMGLIPMLERSPGERKGNPLQCSCLEDPTDGEAWQATVHGVSRVKTTW